MPNGHPDPDASVAGFAAEQRTDLKRKAEGISRNLSEVFAFLTHRTATLEEAKKLLSIKQTYTICLFILFLLLFIHIISIISIVYIFQYYFS